LSHSRLRPNTVQTCAPHWRTLSRSGLQPNVAQNVPLVGGLCHTADFDQISSKHVPFHGRLLFATGFDHIWINNVLIIKNGRYQAKGFQSLINAELKPPSPITMPCDWYAKRYPCQQASTKKWQVSYPSRDKWQMTRIAHNHHTCSIVLNERGKHSYSIYLD
jgi:hypothetical protein